MRNSETVSGSRVARIVAATAKLGGAALLAAALFRRHGASNPGWRCITAAMVLALSILAFAPSRGMAFAVYTTGSGNAVKWWNAPADTTPANEGCGQHFSPPAGGVGAGETYVGCDIYAVAFPSLIEQPAWQGTWTAAERAMTATDSINSTASSGDVIWEPVDCSYPCPEPGEGYIGAEAADLGFCYSPCAYELGLTYNYWDSGAGQDGRGYSASITMNSNAQIAWAVVGPADNSHYNLQQIMMHELGHAAFLNHPVKGPGQGNLMECVTNKGENITTMDGDTLNGLRYLYSDHPYSYSPGSVPC